MQVDPIKPTLKAPGTVRLKLKYDEPPSNFAFKFKLRRYTEVAKEAERLSALEETHAASVAALKATEAAAEAAEITLTGVQSGTGAGGDGNKSLQTQLGDATAAAAQADADAKAAALKVKHADKELTAQNKVRPNARLSPAAASLTAFVS